MSANTSQTTLAMPAETHVDILEKIESQRILGEYSAASSATATRTPSLADEEKATPAPVAEPITHRPTGFKVPHPK